MKCLTLTQPYAQLVALEAKKIETRGWSTPYRGPLAIHAGKNLGPVGGVRGLHRLISSEPFWGVFREAFAADLGGERFYPGDAATVIDQLPLGAIVATCELVDVVSTNHLPLGWRRGRHAWWFTDQEQSFGDYSAGRYAWLLGNIKALPEPIPARGAQGLWTWAGAIPTSPVDAHS